MKSLKLCALDEPGLQVISAHMQDAVVRVGDIVFLEPSKQFALVANRFYWEASENPADSHRRCRTGLHFNRTYAARSIKIIHTAEDAILELLAITFTPGDAPSGIIRLEFAGGGIIELDVECIDAWLSDLGPEWDTGSKPQHDLRAGSDQ